MKALGILAVFALLFLALGCEEEPGSSSGNGSGPAATTSRSETRAVEDGSAETGTADSQGPGTEVLVTGDDDSLPEGCRPRQVAEVLIRFVAAFNRGDERALNQVFFVAEGPSPTDFSDSGAYPWSWYSVSEGGVGGKVETSFTTYDQRELLDYFAERHRRGERLSLLKVGLTEPGVLGEEDNVGMIFILTRQAGDLSPGLGGPGHVAVGKGAINCPTRRIFAWSMEMRPGEKRGAREAARWLCSNPPGWKPGETVVACA